MSGWEDREATREMKLEGGEETGKGACQGGGGRVWVVTGTREALGLVSCARGKSGRNCKMRERRWSLGMRVYGPDSRALLFLKAKQGSGGP